MKLLVAVFIDPHDQGRLGIVAAAADRQFLPDQNLWDFRYVVILPQKIDRQVRAYFWGFGFGSCENAQGFVIQIHRAQLGLFDGLPAFIPRHAVPGVDFGAVEIIRPLIRQSL